jgi:hypothetical protein
MKPNGIQDLERVLESAVVVNWRDLIHGMQDGLVHIEYVFSPSGMLEGLQVWSSIRRGYWLLACSYQITTSHGHNSGVHFDNGCKSEGLAHILPILMEHQSAFTLPPNLGRHGLLQVTKPAEVEIVAAAASIRDASDSAGSGLTATLPAAG